MQNDLGSADVFRLAEQGDVEAQFQLGAIYYSGNGVAEDHAAAAKWFRLAAEQGHVQATFNLGYMSAEGRGVPQNFAEAVKLYQRAGERGMAVAQNNLGHLYEKAEDYAAAAKWYGLAARQGVAAAQASLGFAFAKGRGVRKDETEAVKWYRLAAEQGYPDAQFNLGGMYTDGRGVAQDHAEAARWFRLAAEQGLAIGQNILGGMYARGFGVPRDYGEAMRWHRLAAEQGHSDAQTKLGHQYLHGHGVSPDKALAYVWFALAAAQGDKIASENRDRIERTSRSEIYDHIDKAFAGDTEAQYNLANRLHNGEGIQRDQTAATVWLKMAAQGGNASAQTTLALLLGAKNNPEASRESVRLLSLATDQGDNRARFNLGLQQYLGIGTPIDLESSAVNLIMASLAGVDEAKKNLEMVRPTISNQSWEGIFDRVKWSDLTFLMGPLVEGHLDGVRKSQEHDDGTDESVWLKYERKVADIMFAPSDGGSVLDSVFGERVRVKKFFVGRAIIEGKPVAAITLNARDIVLKDDFPVYWKPSDEVMNAVLAIMGSMNARKWTRHFYRYF